MKLKDMKVTKAERKERNKALDVPYDGDDYGYGLRISLDDSALNKLGITKLPAVGKKLRLEAMVVVISTSQNASDRHERRSVDVQIQKMALADTTARSMEEAIAQGVDEANA